MSIFLKSIAYVSDWPHFCGAGVDSTLQVRFSAVMVLPIVGNMIQRCGFMVASSGVTCLPNSSGSGIQSYRRTDRHGQPDLRSFRAHRARIITIKICLANEVVIFTSISNLSVGGHHGNGSTFDSLKCTKQNEGLPATLQQTAGRCGMLKRQGELPRGK